MGTMKTPKAAINNAVEQQIRLNRLENSDVCVITFTGNPHKANVFTIPLLQRLDSLLDQVEDEHLPCALILTASGTKFFSAGFDLKALTGDAQGGQDLVHLSWKVLARLLVFPAPTFTVFNGHAFGLGLFLGLACDHRIMVENNKKAAFLCLPEITIGLPLGIGFAALAKCKLPPSALRTSALTGKKWSHAEALKHGLIDAVVPLSTSQISRQVLEMAQQLVSTSEKGNLSQIKMEIYGDTYAVLVAQRAKL